MQDDPLDIDALLAHRGWLRQLARELARSDADADDLAQGTLALTLESAPRGVLDLRAWLARVMRNHAARSAVNERARRARELNRPTREDERATDEAVEAAETYALLSRLVVALDEPYRTTLVLRYQEGLTPAQVARRMRVPASTVRTRIERGRARLRAALEAHDPKARWHASLAPLVVVADGGRRAALVGGVVALLAVVGLSVQSLFRSPHTSEPGTLTPPADLAPSERDDVRGPAERSARAPGTDPEPASAEVASTPREPRNARQPEAPVAPATLPAGTLEVTVVVAGDPATEGTVVLSAEDVGVAAQDLRPGGARPGREAALDSAGRARFTGVEAGRRLLAISLEEGHLHQVRVEMPDLVGLHVRVALDRGAVYGFVYDVEGRPISGACVGLNPLVGGGGFELGWTDAFGAYRIPHARAGLAWVALWSKGDPSEASEGPQSQVVVPATGDLRHDFGAPLGLREWRGRLVTRAAALSLGNHTLHLQRTSDGSYRSVVARRGVFELRLEAGEWTAAVDDPIRPGTRVPLATFEVAAEDVEMELTMPGTTVVVELTGAGAAADPSAVVGLAARALDWHWPAWNAAHAEGARWVIEGVPPGEWVLVGGLRDAAVAESRFVVSAEDLVLERRLQLPGP